MPRIAVLRSIVRGKPRVQLGNLLGFPAGFPPQFARCVGLLLRAHVVPAGGRQGLRESKLRRSLGRMRPLGALEDGDGALQHAVEEGLSLGSRMPWRSDTLQPSAAMDERFSYPPVTFLFFLADQPDDGARDALRASAADWNATHTSRFITKNDEVTFTAGAGEFVIQHDELTITLAGGIQDPEREELKGLLERLERLHGCQGIEAVESRYDRAEAYETADFVKFLGDAAPAGFVANAIEALGPRQACEVCGREGRREDRRVVSPLRVNEDFLARTLEAAGSPRPDLVNLEGGGFLVSKRFADELKSRGASGFCLGEVLRVDSGPPSDQYFLLVATTSIVNPCPTHTPMTGEPCSVCGAGGGDRLGELHVEDELLEGLDLFSRHRFGLDALYMSQGLYLHLRAANFNVTPCGAVDRCRHPLAADRLQAARRVAMPSSSTPTPRPLCSVETFMQLLRSPHPAVDCGRCGRSDDRASDRTFELEHLIEPGAHPAELDMLQRRFADVAHLRPLALQADGILLGYQVGQRPSTFPTRAAIDATMGEVDVPAAIKFEKACDWPPLHEEMLRAFETADEASRRSMGSFLGAHGVPFASIVGSGDRLVCADGRIWYFASSGSNGFHNQVIAGSLSEFLGLVTTSLATFLNESASVTRYYEPEGEQYFPRRFRWGTSPAAASANEVSGHSLG